MWELVKHSEKDIDTEGGASDWGKLCARREAQCRPTLEQDCNQSKTTNCVKPFVNCSKKILSAPMSIWDTNLTHCDFSSRLTEMHPKTEFSSYFLCTVNIQSIDRGIYIQFGTHGSDQQKNFITFKRSAGWQVPTKKKKKRVWALNFKPLDNKTNKQTKI